MPPAVGALCCLYDDLTWLKPATECVYAECDRIYFVINGRPWNGPSRDLSRTLAAVAGLDDPDRKIRVVRGDWPSEHDQRNAGLDAMIADGMTYCFVHDCDEIYNPADLRAMKALVFDSPDIACWHMRWFTYWKSERFRIDPPEASTPLVFLRLGAGRFSHLRWVDAPSRSLIDPVLGGICHHMSYARSNEEMRRKISSFSHAHEIIADLVRERVAGVGRQPGHDQPAPRGSAGLPARHRTTRLRIASGTPLTQAHGRRARAASPPVSTHSANYLLE